MKETLKGLGMLIMGLAMIAMALIFGLWCEYTKFTLGVWITLGSLAIIAFHWLHGAIMEYVEGA